MDETQYNTLLNYEDADNDDFYALLNLPRSNPPPTDPEIRSAYRSLTFSFHPDRQPLHLREAAQRYFERINEAYETLIDKRKRTVYDLLGAEGVRSEWSATGVMGGGKRGAGEEMGVGVRAKSPEEFRRWFLELMKRRERKAVNSMVQSRGSITFGIDASDMFSVSEDGTEFFVHVPSPEASSYALGYSFKAPFPTPSGILGEMVGEDDDGDQEEKNNAKNDPYDEAFKTQLQIDAGISGPVEHLVQEVKLRFPDGREEPGEIPLPPQMATTDVRLGATISRVIGDTTSAKGILSKWPFSFLGNSGVSLNAHVLPFPFVHTSLTKAVTPIQGTNPFRVSLTNTFLNWPHLTPPRFGIATSKQIGQRKHAFLSWSSGTLTWPAALHQKIFSLETGLNANLAMAALQQPSSLNIGIVSEPSRPQDVLSMEDEDVDEEEDEEFQELRAKTRKTTQAAESWQVQIQASPAAGGLTFGYGRNIFSGKPATEPVRSEWSSEGYHGVPAEPETRSVRLELTTTASIDMSLAYSIEAVRQVGEFTRIGFGVSLDGVNDLALTLSWSRLGQKIKIPISLCSREVVNADIAAAAVVFPWLTYCAVEFGYLRPRERKKRRRLVARKQRQLKKLIPKKRADSAQAVEMMAEQVHRRQGKEEAQNGLVITKAEYGYMPSTHKKSKSHDPAEYEVIDVTIPVAALVDRSQLVIPRETIKPGTMTSIAEGLFKSLPKPKYTGEDEQLPQHAQPRGPRVVGADQIDETQVVLRRTGPPPYGNRAGWRPRAAEDFGDGGAFPEISVAQYPLDMGRKGAASKSNALTVQVDAEGKVKYDAIARRGHSDNRIVHASFKDLIPLRQRVDMGEVSLDRPSEEQVAEQMENTKNALSSLVDGAVAAQKPKNVKGGRRAEPTFVRYTPANQMGDSSSGDGGGKNDRIMKIVERQQDPMEPPKFKHKKIPRGPPSPPPPVMHSPPRKLTAEDQEAWKIPPPVSNWKNPKGYTVPLDKRLAADGRGLQDVTINDKFAQFAEALFTADRHAREEVRLRAQMQQKLAEKEKAQKEEHLRSLAQKAREERAGPSGGGGRARSYSRSVSRSPSPYSSRSATPSEDEGAARDRERMRRERRQDAERQLRQSRMGTERRIQHMAREQNRDISEKVALGLAKPTQSSESMWDSRLFNQTSGLSSGFNEDNPYDKPLFAAQDAINSIYRPQAQVDVDDEEEAQGEMSKIQKTNRFEVLGKAKEGFRGAADENREGPVQFEKDTTDPFGIDSMIADATAGAGQKRYGIQEAGREEERGSKRARVDEE